MNSERLPQVSIVMPTHNRPALLQEAAASLLAQTFSDWEAIVVDDASLPPAALESADPRLRIVRHSLPLGGAAAKNTGIQQSRGEFLAFLDDDDHYAPEYLARALQAFSQQPDLDVVFMGVSWFGRNGPVGQLNYELAMLRFMEQAARPVGEEVVTFDARVVQALLKTVPMALQRPVVRRAALDRIGPYRADCFQWDCDWAIRAALNARVALVPEGLYRQRADLQGYSSQGTRIFEHLHSNIEIKDRLWQRSRSGEHPEHAGAFRRAAADAHFDLAWHLYHHGQRWHALQALVSSARRSLHRRHLKLVLRLLYLPGFARQPESAPEQPGRGADLRQ